MTTATATKEHAVITPWEVTGTIDYDELVRDFGTKKITAELIQKIEKQTGQPAHFMLRRGVFFSHRDLEWVLAEYAKGNPFALYTGRGPSGHTHIGHLVPWTFTKWLQDAFDVPLYFQLTDDEKFLFKDNLTQEQTHSAAYDNALDIIALGFKQGKTHIFSDLDYIHELYPIALEVAKRLTVSQAKAVFGFKDSDNVGQYFFTSLQSAPAFLPSVQAGSGKQVPVLIPLAIDQDPHFRVTRDVAPKIGMPKPAILHCKFAPGLKGGGKMSASDPSDAIYTTDAPEDAAKKVMRAFTGGRATVAEQRKFGGNPDVDSVFAYLRFFFEPDDKKLEERERAYRAGEILDGENKQYLAEKVVTFLKEHQRKRESARKVLDKFLVKD